MPRMWNRIEMGVCRLIVDRWILYQVDGIDQAGILFREEHLDMRPVHSWTDFRGEDMSAPPVWSRIWVQHRQQQRV